jgi:hypothetical protein
LLLVHKAEGTPLVSDITDITDTFGGFSSEPKNRPFKTVLYFVPHLYLKPGEIMLNERPGEQPKKRAKSSID